MIITIIITIMTVIILIIITITILNFLMTLNTQRTYVSTCFHGRVLPHKNGAHYRIASTENFYFTIQF